MHLFDILILLSIVRFLEPANARPLPFEDVEGTNLCFHGSAYSFSDIRPRGKKEASQHAFDIFRTHGYSIAHGRSFAHNVKTKNTSPEDRSQARKWVKSATSRVERTIGLPNRHATFKTADERYTGTDVHQALMHKYVIEQTGGRRHMKKFKNYPYQSSHPDASLHGKHPIDKQSQGTAQLQEFPVHRGKGHSPSEKLVGSARIITSDNPDKFYNIVAHDNNRDPDNENLHYPAIRS